MKDLNNIGFYKKQFDIFLWQNVFESWHFDKNKHIITGSDNITLWKVKVKPDRFNKMYTDKDVKEDQPYQIIDKFNERKTYKCKLFWNTFKRNTSVLRWRRKNV